MEKISDKKNKIASFPSLGHLKKDRGWVKEFQDRVISDADAYEQEIENIPELQGEGPSEHLFHKIAGELKEKGIWEEDIREEDIQNEKRQLVTFIQKIANFYPIRL